MVPLGFSYNHSQAHIYDTQKLSKQSYVSRFELEQGTWMVLGCKKLKEKKTLCVIHTHTHRKCSNMDHILEPPLDFIPLFLLYKMDIKDSTIQNRKMAQGYSQVQMLKHVKGYTILLWHLKKTLNKVQDFHSYFFPLKYIHRFALSFF